MSSTPASATSRFSWWFALLAPALILGIIGMHSLLVQPDDSMPMSVTHHVSSVSPQHGAAAVDAATTPVSENGGMPFGCSGAMGMCLAILIAAAIVWSYRRGPTPPSPRWLRPPAVPFMMGRARRALDALTPLQRTTVLRC